MSHTGHGDDDDVDDIASILHEELLMQEFFHSVGVPLLNA